MKVTCQHGYFMFREDRPGEVARFNSYFDQDLTAKDDYYTFAALVDAPEYSIIGSSYLGLVATATFQGKPWEVMRANGFVYSFIAGLFLPLATVSGKVDFVKRNDYFSSNGLIQPGYGNNSWSQITGYSADIKLDSWVFNYTEFFYV